MKNQIGENSIYENDLIYVISKIETGEEDVSSAIDKIVSNRKFGTRYNVEGSIPPCHYDIWKNLLKTSDINDKNENNIAIDLSLPIIKTIYNYYKSSKPSQEGNYEFNSRFVSFISLPKKANENNSILLKRKSYKDFYSSIIYNYLFEMSINNIEANVLNAKENGNIPYRILQGFNISTNRNDNPSNMRLYFPFKGYEGIIINKLKKTEDVIYSFIASSIKGYLDRSFNADEAEEEKQNPKQLFEIEKDRITGGYNKIVYGIPGCGKSHHVLYNIIEKDVNKGSIFRTTFYPDYTNSDFIGQLIPKLNNKDESAILYDIQSGPFTNALLEALLNPNKKIYLIIEEINRGNAAAVFGDIFQLLDRDQNGSSTYYIRNYIISAYLHKKIDDIYSVDYDLDDIQIPSNLILIGTMNTSDQNVFTLDTAFKRRWKMEYIKNDIENSSFAKELIPLSTITWSDFVQKINNFILSDNGLDINGEDKQIGAYFISSLEWDEIKNSTPKEGARIFAEKILSYIWNDVAKINRDFWFDSDKYRTLESLIDDFTEKGITVFNNNIDLNPKNKKDK